MNEDKESVLELPDGKILLLESYNGAEIPFDVTEFTKGDVMVNATSMVKLFPGKTIGHFLENSSTKEYLEALESIMRIPTSELCKVVKGGMPQEQGTWMHQRLAVRFARWLSYDFGMWCDDQIINILYRGTMNSNPDIDLGNTGFFGGDMNFRLVNDQEVLDESYVDPKTGDIVPTPFDVTNFGKGVIMVNLTSMIKHFPNKNMGSFRRNNYTKGYIETLSRRTGIPEEELFHSTPGNVQDPNIKGTWAHQRIAVEFAMWLDPYFGVWCDGKILEIIQKGITSVYPDELKRYHSTINVLTQQIKEKEDLLRSYKPKAEYYDQYLSESGRDLYTSTEAINILKLHDVVSTPQELHQYLIDKGIAYRTGSGLLIIKKPYNYETMIEHIPSIVDNGKGGFMTVMNSKWTVRGLGLLSFVFGKVNI